MGKFSMNDNFPSKMLKILVGRFESQSDFFSNLRFGLGSCRSVGSVFRSD